MECYMIESHCSCILASLILMTVFRDFEFYVYFQYIFIFFQVIILEGTAPTAMVGCLSVPYDPFLVDP